VRRGGKREENERALSFSWRRSRSEIRNPKCGEKGGGKAKPERRLKKLTKWRKKEEGKEKTSRSGGTLTDEKIELVSDKGI